MSKLTDRQLRNEWLVKSAPFVLVTIDQVAASQMSSVARYNEWQRDGVTHCVNDRHGHTWITYRLLPGGKLNPQEEVDQLNDEAAIAVMVQGTPAEKIAS